MTTELSLTQEPVANQKPTISKEFKDMIGGVDEHLKAIAATAGDEVLTARTKVAARLDGARVAVQQGACHAAEATQAFVLQNPWKLLGLTLVAGLIATVLVSRRRP